MCVCACACVWIYIYVFVCVHVRVYADCYPCIHFFFLCVSFRLMCGYRTATIIRWIGWMLSFVAKETSFRDPRGWWRCIGCLQFQISFHKRATDYGDLFRKMTYKDKTFYASLPTCINPMISLRHHSGTVCNSLQHAAPGPFLELIGSLNNVVSFVTESTQIGHILHKKPWQRREQT